MKRTALILCIACLRVLPSAMAYCRLPQPRLVCAEYSLSQLVVEATLLRTDAIYEKGDPQAIAARIYTLNVNKVLHGAASGKVRVSEGNDSGRARFDWTPGRKYLLFLFRVQNGNSWAIDGCGNSGPLSQSGSVLRQLDSIQSAHVGVISGVVLQSDSQLPYTDVQVVALGKGGHYAAKTGRNGEFLIKVPEGEYSLSASKTGFSFSKKDISYEDPDQLRIGPGGCAQVQFEGEVSSH